jgi:hypothetical protein
VPFAESYTVDNNKIRYRINDQGNSLTWPLDGLTFVRTEQSGLDMSYSNGTANPPTGGRSISFQYDWWHEEKRGEHGILIQPAGWDNDWKSKSVTAYITMSGAYPLSVDGTGRDQLVKFSTVEPTVTFDKASDLHPDSNTLCPDNDVKIALMNGLGASVPATLKQYMMQITFKPISVFALENLLFPADQLITMRNARVPGDLLVVGSFLAQVRKKSPASNYDVTISAAAGGKGVFGVTNFQNGQGTGSATQNVSGSFVFKYGPIDPVNGNMVDYTIDIEKGTVSPPMMVVVDQPDPDNKPATVILLPPGYPPTINKA